MAAPCENGSACKIFPITTVCGRKRQEGMHTSIVEPKRQRTGHNVIAQNKLPMKEKNPCLALPDEKFYNNNNNNKEMNSIDFSSTKSLKGTKSCRKKKILHRTEKAENQFIQTLKHPRTAYNFFVQSEHSKVSNNLELHEASKSSNFQKTGKILGQKWKEMNPSEKQKFEDLAKLDIIRYQKEVKEYYAKSLHQMKAQEQATGQGTQCNTFHATLGESKPFENSTERLAGLNTGSFEDILVHNNVGCDHPVSLSTMPPLYNGSAFHGNSLNVVPLHWTGQYISEHDYFRTPQINQLSQPSSAGLSIPSYTDIGGIQYLDHSSKALPMSRFLRVPFGLYSDPTSDTFGQQKQILPFVQNDPNSTTYGDRRGMQVPGHSSKALPMNQLLHVPFDGHIRDSISDAFRQQSQTSPLVQNDPNSNANTDRSGMQSSYYSGEALPMSQFLHVPFGQYRDTFGQHSQTSLFVQNDPNSNDLGKTVQKSMFYPK
jgi:hypothetical protein